MKNEFPLIVVHPIDSDIRLVQIAPGVDPSCEPLLSHAGLSCALGGHIEVSMNGMTGVADVIRQFLTSAGNDLSEELLTRLAEGMNDPAYRSKASESVSRRIDQIRTDLDDIHGLDDRTDTPEP